jgi:hypothetical protein
VNEPDSRTKPAPAFRVFAGQRAAVVEDRVVDGEAGEVVVKGQPGAAQPPL